MLKKPGSLEPGFFFFLMIPLFCGNGTILNRF